MIGLTPPPAESTDDLHVSAVSGKANRFLRAMSMLGASSLFFLGMLAL